MDRNKLINLNYLSSTVDNKKEFIADMISRFISEIPEKIEEIVPLIKDKKFYEAKVITHKLQTTLSLFSDKFILDKLRTLENLCNSSVADKEINKAFNDFNIHFQRLLTELKIEYKKYSIEKNN
jgi:HPt (histidine-containing phosphotransfer) domain-containing protein